MLFNVIHCPLESCTYATPNVDAAAAASLLILHNNVHINSSSSKPELPKMNRPNVGRECNEGVWNTFL